MFAGNEYWNEMSTINPQDNTAQARIWSWKAAWDMFLDNPWGVGGYNFQVRFPDYQERFQRSMWGHAAHSLWFTLLPELGVVGVVLYFFLLYYNLKDIFFLKKFARHKTPDKQFLLYLSYGLFASFVGYFVGGSLLSVLYYPHYWYLTALIIAATKIAINVIKENGANSLPLAVRPDLANPRYEKGAHRMTR
jgi:O-antigen ligase